MTRRRTLLALLFALGIALIGCSSSASTGTKPGRPSQLIGASTNGPYQGAGLDPAQPRPSFTLTEATGKPFSFGSRTAGHPTLLYFGYTRCPDVCPTTMADIGLALHTVPVAAASRTYVVFVSTDIKHDTGAVVSTWLSNFSAGSKATWVGLRGSQAQIDAAQAAAHVTIAEDGGATHSAQVLL